jgi:hypothetical protein
MTRQILPRRSTTRALDVDEDAIRSCGAWDAASRAKDGAAAALRIVHQALIGLHAARERTR